MIGCDRVFEYNPYSASVRNKFRTTTKNNLDRLTILEQETQGNSRFKIALISDSHTNYNELSDVLDLINNDDEVMFVIHGGDMTDQGILKEFEIFHNIMDKLDKPWLTVIGNHDCRANGRVIYDEMFGDENYSFVFKNCKFIFFNSVVWELNNEEPDFEWLDNQLSGLSEFDKVFVITHIPSWSDQYTTTSESFYKNLMKSSGVTLSVHGHLHDHYYGEYYEDSVKYLVIGSVDKGSYCNITVMPDSVYLEKIVF